MLIGAYPKRIPKKDYVPLICVLLADGLSSEFVVKNNVNYFTRK